MASCRTTFDELLNCLYSSTLEYLSSVDWTSEVKYVGAAVATAAFILPPLFYISADFTTPTWLSASLDRIPALTPIWLMNLIHAANSFNAGETRIGRFLGFTTPSVRPRPVYTYRPRVVYDSSKDFTQRISISNASVTLFAYPSKGGVIILSPVYTPDFDYLGLDRLHPPTKRLAAQNEEDELCRQLLLLGAKWWDSLSRYYLVKGAHDGEQDCEESLEYDESALMPTVRERLWCSVAWPSTNGFVIAEFHETRLGTRKDGRKEYAIPEDIARLGLCKDMDERAQMLKETFDGKWFASVDDYVEEGGDAFLAAWDWKVDGKGEVGAMERTS